MNRAHVAEYCSAAGKRASGENLDRSCLLSIIDRQVHRIEQSRTMYAISIVLLNALSARLYR